jgi:hypothetical protein
MSTKHKRETAEAAVQKIAALRKLTMSVSRALTKDTAHDAVDVLDTVINDCSQYYIDVTLDGRDMRIVLEDHHTP